MPPSALSILSIVFLVYLGHRLQVILSARRAFPSIPAKLNLFNPVSLLGLLLPETSIWRVIGFHWKERRTLYQNSPLKTLSFTSLISAPTFLFTANLDAFYTSLALNSDFEKSDNPALNAFGPNVVTSRGDVWKRHRRITAPAFNHSTYENVWNTTVDVYKQMMTKEGWGHDGVDEVPKVNISKTTHKLALFLIAIVGFNIPMSWDEPARDVNGKLTPQSMILDVAQFIVERGILPKFAYKLGIRRLGRIEEAYTQFEKFVRERIADREAEFTRIRALGGSDEELADSLKDVFGRLVNARVCEGKQSLSDSEILGNCFAFTFAGHETSANTLAATLGLLALYPDEQEWVYNSIIDVVGDSDLTFDDFDKLEGVLACLFEGIRLFPAAWLQAEVAAKDTTLLLSRRDNPNVKEVIPVKKGTVLLIDTIGIGYDEVHFPDPEKFNPRRWKKSAKSSSTSVPAVSATQANEISGSSPSTTLEGFIGFSYGPRSCLGHKFAKVESVCFLALLLRDWRILPVMRPGESGEQWRERVLKPGFGQALLIGEVPLRLIRRKQQ